MTTARRAIIGWGAAMLVAAVSPAVFGQADDSGYGDGYQAGTYGRVRYAENGATIERAGDHEGATGDRAGVNAPIFPGDTVKTDGDQRIEVQLAGGSLVRIDRDSDVQFQSLPDPSAKYQDNTVLVLRRGALRIGSRVPESNEFRVDTDASSVYLQGEGDFRIEIDAHGQTRVASYRGVAEVGGTSASVLVRGGTQSFVSPGRLPDDPVAFRSVAEDGFDRWCEARDAAYRTHDHYARAEGDTGGGEAVRSSDVPEEVRPYYGELSAYGNWATVPDYGTVWYPSGVSSDWRPYYDGSWTYGPGGYFWVGSEPWGWAPYHYGCWQWIAGFGWCWCPGHVFGGAWVSWSWGSAYVGWAPLGYWGYPCWYGPRYYGYYDPHCWTFVNYSNIAAVNVRRYAVPVSQVGDHLKDATVVARAPHVAPRAIASQPLAREKALREVVEDRSARLRVPTGETAGQHRLVDIQDRLARRGIGFPTSHGVTAPRGASEPSRAVPTAPSQHAMPAPPPRGGASRPDPSAPKNESRTAPHAYPRRFTEDPRRSDAPAREREAAPDTRQNLRDFYQRMSRPLETQQDRRQTQSQEPRYQAPSPRYETLAPRYQAPMPRYQAPAPAPRAMPQPQAGPHPGPAPAPHQAAPRPAPTVKEPHRGR